MAAIAIENVEILNNPARFMDDFQLKITFECLPPGVNEDLEWKLIYVGSAQDEKFDQELDSVLVGPVVVGKNEFVLEAPPPDPEKIPRADMVSLTVVLLTGSYREREFVRIGYYLNNRLFTAVANGEETQWTPEMLDKYDSNTSLAHMLQRNIAADKPGITKFPIDWDEPNQELLMPTESTENNNHHGVPSMAAQFTATTAATAVAANVDGGNVDEEMSEAEEVNEV